MNNPVTEWQIKPLVSFGTNRVAGYSVERVHNPYTEKARIESLGTSIYHTEAAARAAIAKAAA